MLDPLTYSDPIVKVYEGCVDDLLVNLAKHFNVKSTGNTGTFEYEVELLARLAAVRTESAAIIANHIKQNEPMIELAVKEAMLDALKEVEPELREAAKRGLLNDTEMNVSDSIQDRLQSYSRQARNTLNLVNANMVEGSARAFRKGVMAASDALRETPVSQSILNAETGKVILGSETLQQALKKAVRAMSEQGVTAFYDKSGREWSAEAYTRMVIRTTCSNAANQGVIDRNADYGNDLIWVRTNATARPGCYPWQGKVISMSDRKRNVLDGNGKIVLVFPVSQTTYGQPDGIYGCNCHHGPMNVFIPGASIVRGNDKMSEPSENDDKYNLTQRQRYLERAVRYAKREVAMLKKAGASEETISSAMQKVRDRQKKVRQLVAESKETLVRDYSREAIYS